MTSGRQAILKVIWRLERDARGGQSWLRSWEVLARGKDFGLDDEKLVCVFELGCAVILLIERSSLNFSNSKSERVGLLLGILLTGGSVLAWENLVQSM